MCLPSRGRAGAVRVLPPSLLRKPRARSSGSGFSGGILSAAAYVSALRGATACLCVLATALLFGLLAAPQVALGQTDTTPPSIYRASIGIGTTKLEMAYTESLDENSVPAGSAFTVKVDDTVVSLATSNPVSVSGSTVTLTLAEAVSVGSTVTVSYAAPATSPIQDLASNAAASFSDRKVTVGDFTPPSLSTATVDGTTLTLTYNEALDESQVPSGTDYEVKVNEAVVSLVTSNPVSVRGSTVTLTLAAAVSAGATVTVSYALSGLVGIVDLNFNYADDFADKRVTVLSEPPVTAPGLSTATLERGTPNLALTFDKALDTASMPAGSAFTVKVNDTVVSLATSSPVAIIGSKVALTLAAAVSAGATVTVSYAAPATSPLQDADGNAAADFTDESVTVVDTTPPRLTTATLEAGTTTLTLTYNEALDEGSVPDAGWFTVLVNAVTTIPTLVSVKDSTVTLTLTEAVSASATVTLLYGQRSDGLRDLAGNPAPDIDNRFVTIVDTTAPSLSTATLEAGTTTLTLTYNEALDEGSVPSGSAFTVTVGGSGNSVTAVDVRGATVTLTLTTAVSAGTTVTVSYTAPAANRLRDEASNAAADFSGQAVTFVDTTAPRVSTATVVGTTLTLTYNEALDTASVPAGSAFTVKVDGTEVSLADSGSVAVSGSTVVLALATAVTSGQMVTASYAVPGTNPLRDLAANAAAAFSDARVTNLTPSTDASLGGLAVTDGGGAALELSPAFSSATRAYEVSVGHAVPTVGVTATVNHEGATLTGSLTRDEGTAEEVMMTSDEAAELTELAVGDNVLTVTVTAEDDRTKRVYTLTVTRPPPPPPPPPPTDATLSALVVADGSGSPLPLSPAFSPITMAYEVEVDNAVTSVEVTATASGVFATLTGSLTRAGGMAEEVMMTSGEAAELTGLAVGDNVLEIAVTPLGISTAAQVYTLTVTRLSAGMSLGATPGALVGFAGEGRGYDRRGGDDER